jgi:transposase
MHVLNFSHPLTEEQKMQIQKLAGKTIEGVRTIPVQISQKLALEEQIAAIVDTIELTPEEWQTQQLLINPPGYAPAAFVLLAMLHGRIGHFPALIRMRPIQNPITSFEVAEILNLQNIRDRARMKR